MMSAVGRLSGQRPSRRLRHARVATGALFLTNGMMFANLVPRYPEIKAALSLSDELYGQTVIAIPAGAVIMGLLAGMAIRRFGAATVAMFGTVLTGVMVTAAGWSPSLPLFALALFIGGGTDAITDVAQNRHGLVVARQYGRSIFNTFHAIWSLGAVIGGTMAAGAIAIGMPVRFHLLTSSLLCVAIVAVAYVFCLDETKRGVSRGSAGDDGRDSAEAVPVADAGVVPTTVATRVVVRSAMILAVLVILGIAGGVVEDAGSSWATLYLSRSLGAAPALAVSGFVALVGLQFIGRIAADRFVDLFGYRRVVAGGALLVAVSTGAALAWPTVWGTVFAFGCAGFGCAALVPAAMHEADHLPGIKPGTGLTVVSWLMRIGFLAPPPIVGWIAEHYSLRVGLISLPLAGVVALLCACAVSGKEPRGNE